MTVQGKMEPASLASAMAAAFGEIDAVIKGKENPAFKNGGKVSKYADIAAVIDAIKPALINHDLFFTQHPIPHEKGVQVETFLHHANGQSMSMGSLFVPANKQDAQGFGSALTYARRYALVTAFGVPVEDDDGNAAAKSAPRQEQAQPLVDDGQWSEIVALIEATNTDAGKFCAAYSIESVKALPANTFAKARTQLQRKLAQMAQPETADA